MKLSAKTDYACRALMELSLHWPSTTPVQLQTISERQHVPIKFLTQITLLLKQLGYIESLRGKKGGYLLSRPPKDIVLSDVIYNLETNGHRPVSAPGQENRVISALWTELNEVMFKAMSRINFEDLCNRHKASQNVVTFEI